MKGADMLMREKSGNGLEEIFLWYLGLFCSTDDHLDD